MAPVEDTRTELWLTPFDRLLVAQAEPLDLTIVIADPAVAPYPVASLPV